MSTFRRNECVGRLGGDEFMVLVNNSEQVNIDNIKKRIQQNIDEFNEKNNKPWKIEASCGVLKYSRKNMMDKKKYYCSIDKLLYLDKKKRKGVK